MRVRERGLRSHAGNSMGNLSVSCSILSDYERARPNLTLSLSLSLPLPSTLLLHNLSRPPSLHPPLFGKWVSDNDVSRFLYLLEAG